MSQLGYGKQDVVGQPYDFYTNVALQGVTGTLTSGQTLVMNNNKLVTHIGATLAALTVTLPLNPPDGATAEVSNSVNTFAITSLTVGASAGDVIIGTAVTTAASGATVKYQYTLNGDVTKGAGPRTWVRVS